MNNSRSMVMMFGVLLLSSPGCTFDSAGLPATDVAKDGSGDRGKPKPELGPPDMKKDKLQLDESVDVLAPDLPKGCTQGSYKCVAKESHICKGGAVYALDTLCPMDCNPATGRCYSFDHSNGVSSLVGQSTYKWTITGGVTVDTTTGKLLPPQAGVAVYDKTKWVVLVVGSMTLEKGVTLKVLGSRPLIIVAWDHIYIKGTLDISANG